MANKNQWTALGTIAVEPLIKKLGDKKLMATTVIISETNGNRAELPVCAYNKKARVLAAVAHKGAIVFAKGVFQTKETITSLQAKRLIQVSFKITDFQVLVREPVEVETVDYVDTVACYDPDDMFEGEEEDDND